MKEKINMNNNRPIPLCTIWVAFWILMIPLLVGCGEEPKAGKTSITIPINLSPTLANNTRPLRHPTRMGVKVVNETDHNDIIEQGFYVSPEDFEGGIKTVSFDGIPVEKDLQIKVSIFDENDDLLFEGEEVINIGWGETGKVVIHMEYRGEPNNEPDLTDMVLIPAGEFEMGDHQGVGEDDERPVHPVYLDEFYIDRYEVTVGRYREFIEATGHPAPPWNEVSQFSPTDQHPIVLVSWHDAAAYAQWAGKKLPTEAQWERAARGGLVGKRYPWGNIIDIITRGDANYEGTLVRDKWEHTAPVGSFPENDYGLFDMAGNVWEWCADEYVPDYYWRSPRDNPTGPGNPVLFVDNDFTNVENERVLRGGSWLDRPDILRCAFRDKDHASSAFNSVGFRCAWFAN